MTDYVCMYNNENAIYRYIGFKKRKNKYTVITNVSSLIVILSR